MTRSKQGETKKTVARETKLFRATLKSNKRIAKAGAPLPTGATHAEKRDTQGNLILQRKRFSAA
jgi:hypothetical protein